MQACILPTQTQRDGSCTMSSSADVLVALSGRPWFPAVTGAYFYARTDSGLPADQDAGAYPQAAAKSLQIRGMASQGVWPDTMPMAQKPGIEYQQQALDHRVLDIARAPSLVQIKAALDAGWGVLVAMELRESFSEIGADGLWRDPAGRVVGGHQMRVYGYDDEIEAGPGMGPGSLFLRQTWGEWGEVVQDHPDLGRGALRMSYRAVERKTAGIYDVICYKAFDATAGD